MSETWDEQRALLSALANKQIRGTKMFTALPDIQPAIAAALDRLDAAEAKFERYRNDTPERCHALLSRRGVPDTVSEGEGFPSLEDRIKGILDRLDALQRFKDWTHAYLDGKGIPADPGGQYHEENCRIEGRLDLVFARLDAAEAKAATPTMNPEHETIAAKFRAESRAGDGKPEGTREALERCAKMLDSYIPELFPANDKGQVDFVRAMAESTSDEIRAYLASNRALEAEVTDLRRCYKSQKKCNDDMEQAMLAAEAALRSLASWLGVGGYNADEVDAAVFERKIRSGVDAMIRVETARARGPQISDSEEMALLRRVNAEQEARIARLVAAAEPVATLLDRVDRNERLPFDSEWNRVFRRLRDEVRRIQPGGTDAPPRTPDGLDRPNLAGRPAEDASRGNHDE